MRELTANEVGLVSGGYYDVRGPIPVRNGDGDLVGYLVEGSDGQMAVVSAEEAGVPWYETAQTIGEDYVMLGGTLASGAGAALLAFPPPDPSDAISVAVGVAGLGTATVGGVLWLVGRAGELFH